MARCPGQPFHRAEEGRRSREKYDLKIPNVFHAGDGNLHPLILFDWRNAEQKARVMKAGMEILALCVELGGTISGEHGVGLEKMDSLRLVLSEADIRSQLRVKRAFDPKDLANPGKIFPLLWRWSVPHDLASLWRRLEDIVGNSHMDADPESTSAFAVDGLVPSLTVRPGTQDEVAEVVSALCRGGCGPGPLGRGDGHGHGESSRTGGRRGPSRPPGPDRRIRPG